jgi:fatty acid desaturase
MNISKIRPVEWPTIFLIALVYGVLALLVWNHASLPWWVVLPIGAYTAALHSSLQHEVLHGHPTRNRLLNEALVFITPTMWLPFHRYRETHLTHHNDMHLTCPVQDPESYYLLPDDWAKIHGLKRSLFIVNQTLGGRMLIGPAVSIARFWSSEFLAIWKGDKNILKAWVLFIMASATTLSMVYASGMPMWKYYILIAYPGISLALIRSYCEHQAVENLGERTIIVEATAFWNLLFLYNNLHVAHHTFPSLAWYKLPQYFKEQRASLIAKNNGYTMDGYAEIFRRFFVKPKEPIPHPNLSWLAAKPERQIDQP